MDYKQKQKELDVIGYNHQLIKNMNYFYIDNIFEIIYESNHNNVSIKFIECNDIKFNQFTSYEKPLVEIQQKNITTPYYIHSIIVGEYKDFQDNIYRCKIIAFPTIIELECSEIYINK
jgi:hypothetical protein